jgi:hypothetical protein
MERTDANRRKTLRMMRNVIVWLEGFSLGCLIALGLIILLLSDFNRLPPHL